MLPIPNDLNSNINIIGLDPGSNTFGIAVLTINVITMNIVGCDAWTINGTKMIEKNSWLEQLYGNRTSRVLAIEENLLSVFNYYQPLIIVTESQYINSKFPQAGIALTEVLCSIRRAVMQYDIWKELYLFPPSCVKNAVGAGGGTGKETVKEKLLMLTDLNYTGAVPLHCLDEHSIDALAAGYAKWKELLI